MKICPVGAELFHTDGRTDMRKLTVAFRNFTNAPKMINHQSKQSLYVIYSCTVAGWWIIDSIRNL